MAAILSQPQCVSNFTGNSATPKASNMMTSSNENFFRITGPLWGESTDHRWIPLTRASDAELWCFLWFVPELTNLSANNRDADDLRRHRAHYDVTVMINPSPKLWIPVLLGGESICVVGEIPAQRDSYVASDFMSWRHHVQINWRNHSISNDS